MRLLGYECQTTFPEDFSIAELFGEEAIRDIYKRAKAEWKTIVYTEQNCLWYLTINAGIGTENRTKNLVNYTRSYGKNIMGGYWIAGRMKIWGII